MAIKDALAALKEPSFEDIQEGIEALNIAIAACDKATRAGIDVAEQRAQAVEALSKLRNIKQVYHPNR